MTTFAADGSPITDPEVGPTPFTLAEQVHHAKDQAAAATADPDPFATPVDHPGGEVAVPEPGGEVATTEDDPDANWPHDFLEFMGDKLAIRKPTQQALAGFSLASSKYVAMEVKNDITGLFIARHLSPASYGRVFSRLMNPDDTAYSVESIGELMKAIVMTVANKDG